MIVWNQVQWICWLGRRKMSFIPYAGEGVVYFLLGYPVR